MLAVWPRLPFRQGFALISLVFQSYCWWEALFCSCILQSVEQGLQPLRAGGQQGGEGEGYWQQRWRLRSRLCSLHRQEHIRGRQHTPCQGCSCQKKRIICPPTWNNLVPDLLLLDSRALARVKVLDGGIEVCQGHADLAVPHCVHLVLIMMTWTLT